MLVPIGFLVVGLLLVGRFIRKVVLKAALVAALIGLGVALWIQRAELSDCADTCSCTLFGREVRIPADKHPNC